MGLPAEVGEGFYYFVDGVDHGAGKFLVGHVGVVGDAPHVVAWGGGVGLFVVG